MSAVLRSAAMSIRARRIGPLRVIVPVSKAKRRPARSRSPRTSVAVPAMDGSETGPVTRRLAPQSVSRPRPKTMMRRGAVTCTSSSIGRCHGMDVVVSPVSSATWFGKLTRRRPGMVGIDSDAGCSIDIRACWTANLPVMAMFSSPIRIAPSPDRMTSRSSRPSARRLLALKVTPPCTLPFQVISP